MLQIAATIAVLCFSYRPFEAAMSHPSLYSRVYRAAAVIGIIGVLALILCAIWLV